MLPMVMPAAERKAVLGPDDLGADLEAHRCQASPARAGVAPGVPDIGDRAWKQRPGIAPVRAVVVGDLAEPVLVVVDAGVLAPSRVVVDAIGRVGDHQVRLHAAENLLRRLQPTCCPRTAAGADPAARDRLAADTGSFGARAPRRDR